MIILSNGEKHRIGQPFTPNIGTIATALSNINRYTGHVGQYSVAQHCVLVSEQLHPALRLSGLLHDAPEAYIGDISSPLKRHIASAYRPLEDFYHKVIDEYYGVTTEHDVVKTVDIRMLITEAKSFGIHCDEFPVAVPYPIHIERWPAEHARVRFLECFDNCVTEGWR
jgi:hypothetical protein